MVRGFAACLASVTEVPVRELPLPEGELAAAPAFGTPPGIVLSPQDPALLGRATADLPITAAFAVASLDPVRYADGAGTFSSRSGRRPGYDLTLIAAEVLDEPARDGTSASGRCCAGACGCASPACTWTG